MKHTIFRILIAAATFTACNNNTETKEGSTKNSDTAKTTVAEQSKPASVNEVVAGYLQLKNALVNDNATEAAKAGEEIKNTWQKADQTGMTEEQKKVFNDVNEELLEHAEHISKNADKIEHQREHFVMLSDVMYVLVKGFKTSQTLYKDHCPMYNDGKGANWLSEIKEIKNPYYGQKMVTCGSVKEELKQ